MARKKQPRKNRLRTLVLLGAIPLIVWSVAFLVWFYWEDLSGSSGKEAARRQDQKVTRSIQKEEPRARTGRERTQEKITDEDRRSLEDIIKHRN